MASRYKRNEAARKSARKRAHRKKRKKLKKLLLTLLLIIIIGFLAWGKFLEVNIIVANDNTITNSNIPESFNNTKIIHFSDILYQSNYNEQRLTKLVNKINSYKPDIVIFTGDLINSNYKINEKDMTLLTQKLSKIESKLGKYAVIGDNDYNNENYNTIMYDSDFKILKNNYDTIYNKDNNPILIYGLDSTTKGSPKISTLNKKSLNNISYKIIAMHEGDYISEFINDYDVDLVLAGHSLNGQVRFSKLKPMYLPKGAKEYYNNNYKVNNTDIFISNGLGNFKYDFRLFNTPSINIYRLKIK